jgi:glutaryl-CoA dehydrogenase
MPATPAASPPPDAPIADLGTALGTDYFLIRPELSDLERDYLDRTRRFVEDEVLPVINDYWERAELPLNLIRRLGELGLVGDGIDYPGVPSMSPIAAGLINMELNRGDGSVGTALGVHAGLAMRSIAMLGSEDQKRAWLPAMARMEKLGAFALTEPDHGSDSVALETTARRDGDEYIISGSKRWIGFGSVADVVVVWARDAEDGEVKGFLVERPAVGYEAEVITGKAALRAVWQAAIELRDVRVSVDNMLPGARSFKDTARVLKATRQTCAWAALGHAVAAYDAALAYGRSRRQFGKPLISFQMVQERLVQMLAEVTAMQLYCLRIGRLMESDQLSDTIAALAKLNNTVKARQVIAEARNLLGGNGLLLEHHVIRHMSDIEAIYTYEGTEAIQTLLVGRDITGVAAFA